MAKTWKRFLTLALALCMCAFFGVFAAACSEPEEKIVPETVTYVVSFNVQGHGTAPSAQSIEKDGYATKPADLTADGYDFGGWYKEADCTNEFVFTSEKITADTVIYAKWTETEVAIPDVPTTINSTYHIYNSGHEGDVNGDAYSTNNVWEYTNNFVNPPVSTTYYYNEITFTGAVRLFWHIDDCEADVTYKMDIRVGDDFKQDATIRSTYNMWVENGDSFEYSEWNRTFGLIGLQIAFTQDQIDNRMFKVILQNPSNEEVTLRIICAVGDAH